jgi:anti-sigma factor RsiW
MDDCRAVKREFTAWCDGELSRRETERVERHLAACAACSAYAQSLSAAIRWQRQALPHVTAVGDHECAPLQAKLRRALAAEIEPRAQGQFWSWIFRPVTIATAAAMIAIVVLFSVLGGTNAVLIPLGVKAPPVAISSEPDLFANYQLIQHLDAMENFDTVESVPLDEDQPLREG